MSNSGINTTDNANLADQQIYQIQLEANLDEAVMALPMVRTIDFPTGQTFNINSVGDAVVNSLPEGTDLTFSGLDSAEVQVTKDDPQIASISKSKIFCEDSQWQGQLVTKIPERISAALANQIESDVHLLTQSQTLNNPNAINGIDHRYIATGAGETMQPQDFAKARFALVKAKVPTSSLICFVDPSVAFALETLTQLANISDNPRWEGIVRTGISSNMRFVMNIYGFDVIETNLLTATNESITATTGGNTTAGAGVANYFLNVGQEDILPFVMAWVARPEMTMYFDDETQEYKFYGRYRVARQLTRRDNLVVIISDTDQVA